MVGISGCTIGEDTTASNPSPAPSQSPAAAQSFNNPIIKERKAESTLGKGGEASELSKTSRVPGLLQSTDPAERAKQVQAKINQGSKDPFAGLPPLISFKTPAGNTAKASDPLPSSSSSAPAPTSPRPTAPSSVANAPRSSAAPTKPSIKPGLKAPKAPAIAALPPLPEPTLAKSVEVTGVIIVAGVPIAIVQAPEEPTSRYVQAGQRLSNGKILVKRIEMNGGSEPVVILEQNGVEVARTVGDKISAPTASVLHGLRFA